MSAQADEPTTRTDLACAVCVARLVDAEAELLPETDVEVVAEHLSQCPHCRLFNEQLDVTREILADLPAAIDARSTHLAGANELSLGPLYRVATALDVVDADELLQQILLEALVDGELDARDLVDRLVRAAAEERRHPTRSLNQPDADALAYDPDGETAELFYPEFYDEGPDGGRFIDSPNDWGHVPRSAPEEEVATVELYGVTDAAIDELPNIGMRLLTLVDIEGVALDKAAAGIGVSKERAAQALNAARIHVRRAIDSYLHTARA